MKPLLIMCLALALVGCHQETAQEKQVRVIRERLAPLIERQYQEARLQEIARQQRAMSPRDRIEELEEELAAEKERNEEKVEEPDWNWRR